MIWWIAVGIVVLSLVLLVLVVLSVLRRLPGLRRALVRSRARAADAQALQATVAGLEQRLSEVGGRAESAARRAFEIKNSGIRR
jgi:heme exporter protein D